MRKTRVTAFNLLESQGFLALEFLDQTGWA